MANFDPQGSQHVSPEDQKATYYFGSPITVASGANDLYGLYGASGKLIRLEFMSFNVANSSGSAYLDMALLQRSSGNTGGATTADTPVKANPNDPASAASGFHYTSYSGGLTRGQFVATLTRRELQCINDGGNTANATASYAVSGQTSTSDIFISDFTKGPKIPGIWNNPFRGFVLSFNGVPPISGTTTGWLNVVWSEENYTGSPG